LSTAKENDDMLPDLAQAGVQIEEWVKGGGKAWEVMVGAS
jgi:hypothetical protein